MKVMLTVLYLSIGIKGLAFSLCLQDPKTYTIGELERIVHAVATHKRVPSTVILNRILRKIRYRQRTEKMTSKSPLQNFALDELLSTKVRPPPIMQPPPLPDPRPRPPKGMTGVLFAPGCSSGPFPQPCYIPMLLPPLPGVTIRVDSDQRVIPLPEVTVTLSPQMTVVEALKQAESKYRPYMGLSPMSEEDVITFGRSSVAECFVVVGFRNAGSSAEGYWKIIVSDKTGEVIYESICLPSRSEVPVKPGMIITLIFTTL